MGALRRTVFVGWVVCALALSGCAGATGGREVVDVGVGEVGVGLAPVGGMGGPGLTDDLGRDGLREAALQSLEYLARLDPQKTLAYGRARYTALDVQQSIQEFITLLEENPEHRGLRKAVRKGFRLYRGGGRSKEATVTGYYVPILYGSRLPGIDYTVPLYAPPEDRIVVELGRFREDLDGTRIVGRFQGGTLVPYYSRHEIDRLGMLSGRGREIAWLSDPVEAFFLHIQGSGRIILPDGTDMHVRYAGTNGRPYRAIGNLLVQEGKITADEKSMPTLKAYLRDHPDDRDRVLDQNESYVFFEPASYGPVGSLGVVLTAGRSVAADPRYYPAGALAYLETEVPVLGEDGSPRDWRPVGRFVFIQDRGGAVQGPHRLDLFWGEGEDAGRHAGWMNRPGKLYVLAPGA